MSIVDDGREGPPRRFSTVRARFTIAACASVGIALILGAVLLVIALRSSMIDGVDAQLRLRAADVVAQAERGALPSHVPGGDGESGAVIQVLDSSDRIVAASDNVPTERAVTTFDAPTRGDIIRTVDNPPVGDGSPFRILAETAHTATGDLLVYVGVSVEPVEDSIGTLVRLLAAAIPSILVLVGACSWLLLGRALKPVENIRRRLGEITTTQLARRVPEPVVMDEIGRLARAVNGTLARLEAATRRQRTFVSDASHELRSPLAAVRTQLEVAAAHPETTSYPALVASLLDQHNRIESLVDDLLVLARSDEGRAPAHRLVDLDELVLGEVQPLRARGRVRLDLSAVAGGRLHGDPEQLRRMVRNLLENAERHARTTIAIGLTQHDDKVVLAVADDGPGIPLEDRAKVFERFTRLDEGRSRDHGGAGLGLAIVHDIVTSHGGDIRVTGSPPPGGARFIVTLPARTDAPG